MSEGAEMDDGRFDWRSQWKPFLLIVGGFLLFCFMPMGSKTFTGAVLSGLALLLAGPSLSVPNMLVIRKVLGTTKTVADAGLVVFYSTVGGRVFGVLAR